MASTVLPNGIIIPEKYSRDWYADLYHNWQELDNLLGGGTPKDGTLTIQKNGSTVGTFSANQATDETINLSVPTKTSDLTNDSGFITGVAWDDVSNKPTFAAVATSGSYDDLSNKPTIPTVNNATLTIQKNGATVNSFTANASSDVTCNITVPTKTSDLNNDSGFITADNTKIPLAGSNQISGSLIPATTNAYDLGSSSYQWNNAYIKSLTINGVACGDILTHNANEFVDVTNAQTVAGNKTFTSLASKSNVLERGSLPTAHITDDAIFISVDKNYRRAFAIFNYYYTNGNGRLSLYAYNQNTTNYDNIGLAFNFDNANNSKSIIPTITNSFELGTSTNKWKTFNGINPGALSLPSADIGCVDIKSTVGQYLKDNNTSIYEFTAPFDGWVCVGIVKGSLRVDNNTTNISSGSENLGWWQCYTIPFMKNNSIQIKINKMDPADDYVNNIMWKAFIYPCQGNV